MALTLITIASEQAWPNINAILHYRPEKLVLLHTNDIKRSQEPAIRLKQFCQRNNLVGESDVRLDEIPSNSLNGIIEKLDAVKCDWGLNGENTMVNLTGGTKFMGVALYAFSLQNNSIQCVYFERDKIYSLHKSDNGNIQELETLPPDLANVIDPYEIAICHLDRDFVVQGELLKPGPALLTSNEAYIQQQIKNLNFSGLIDPVPQIQSDGDGLEYKAAVWLMKTGAKMVRRSMKVRRPSSQTKKGKGPQEQEIDLVFNHGGQRLHFVECKDRKNTPAELFDQLCKCLSNRSEANKIRIGKVRTALKESLLSQFRDDLFYAKKLSGLAAQTVWIHRHNLDPHSEEFCKDEGICVISRDTLHRDIPQLPCFQS